MPVTLLIRYPLPSLTNGIRLLISSGLFLLLLAPPSIAAAAIQNQIQRIAIKPAKNFTRITVNLTSTPEYRLIKNGNGLRLLLTDTDGGFYKSLRRYSDQNIGGLVVSRRGNDTAISFAIAAGRVGWRTVQIEGIPAIAIDVGSQFLFHAEPPKPLPGRERILAGAEKLLKNFDPPLKPEIPFIPTDRKELGTILNDAEQQQFLAAEGALYKGKLTAAEDAFQHFVAMQVNPVRPLALYRLGEAQYRLQKYPQALESFREAAQLWPGFLSLSPAAMFYFGDSIARNGDLPGGRQLLARLIVAHADKKYAPTLLVRMADVLSRQGGDANAFAIYRTVSEAFLKNKAQQIAVLKLADREFFNATPDTYIPLAAVYGGIAASTPDYDLREEATFKKSLLESINGPADLALDSVLLYQKRFPKGVYSTVVKDIREDLVALVYQGKDWGKEDAASLIRLTTDNQEYLGSALRVSGFLQSVSAAFEKGGRPLDLIALYAGLLERPGVDAENSAYMTLQVADQAELLGDTVMARKVLQDFLRRYPEKSPGLRWAQERLAAIQFAAGELQGVRTNLSWLLDKQERASYPVSYYYLGRAMQEGRDYPRAAVAMESYLAATRADKVQPLLTGDAYYVAATAKLAMNDSKGAAAMLEEALKRAPKGRKDQFMYKLAELSLQNGQFSQARTLFEKIAKEGSDPDWQQLARQNLAENKKLSQTSVSPDKK